MTTFYSSGHVTMVNVLLQDRRVKCDEISCWELFPKCCEKGQHAKVVVRHLQLPQVQNEIIKLW